MLKLLRYFSITSFFAVVIVTGFLGIFYHQISLNKLKDLAEAKNVELTHVFSDSLWSEFAPFLTSASGLGADELRVHPDMARLQEAVLEQMRGLPVVKINVYNLAGLMVFSTETSQIGIDKSTNAGFLSARSGKVVSELTYLNTFRAWDSTLEDRDIISSFVPIHRGDSAGSIEGVFELDYDVTRLLQRAKDTQRNALTGVNLILALLYLVLYFIVRKTEVRLKESQDKVKQFNEHLEETVEARTRQLAVVNDRLEYQTLHDSLTKLPNRTLLTERLQQAIQIAHREKSPLALIIMDLDHFRAINDPMGHPNGDLLLQQVGARLKETLRETDTIARLGGDEFALLLPGVKDSQAAIMMVRKIQKLVEETFVIAGQTLDIGVSLGIALFPEDGEEAHILMRRAEVGMYVAKRTKSGFAFYNSDQDQYSLNRLTLMGELRHAIEHEELLLHFQPKVGFKTGRISGVEALVRWRHPQSGLRSPDEFIPLAEQTGLIKPLTSWVRNEALRQCDAWHQTGLDLTVAVNISASNLQDPEFPDRVAKLLKAYRVTPAWLELEITESAIMVQPARAIETITRLSAMGILISIDDYGTGYSSLAYLKKLPVSSIKIDKSFVMNMLVNENDAVIVRSTIELGHNLGLKVVAEGVENQATWDQLKVLGCDFAQGYHLSRPIPASELLQWLNESPWGLGNKQDVSRL